MHFAALIAVVVIALGVRADGAVAAEAAAAKECGNLGVLAPPSLPEGVDPAALRPCAEHPLDVNSTVTAHDGPQPKAGACFFGDPYGCARGYCWQECNTPGSGQWCWTAWNNGFGNWRTCSGKEDCAPAPTADCGQGCPRCGCSC